METDREAVSPHMWLQLILPCLRYRKANCINCGSVPEICTGNLPWTKVRQKTKLEQSVGITNKTMQNRLERRRMVRTPQVAPKRSDTHAVLGRRQWDGNVERCNGLLYTKNWQMTDLFRPGSIANDTSLQSGSTQNGANGTIYRHVCLGKVVGS